MLQRAANNAYSWWWASHIRTKQSKWMEQNLQDMEVKVKDVLKLLQEDGDSFARRAEMYYKRRPELIHFVEETFKAYRALAERYDHLSTELQNANSTIASVFPEQLPFAMEDEDESGSPKMDQSPKSAKKSWEISKGGYIPYVPENSKGNFPAVPKVPKPTVKDVKGLVASSSKRKSQKIISPKGSIRFIPKSGLSIPEGLDEIHRLHKRILELQTEKEFARSTHECAMVKYWELDNEIQEIHKHLCSLEDEFGEGTTIADDEARIVMEVTALKSCRDTLAQLEDKQTRSAKEAQVEKKRIAVSRKKLDALRKKFELDQEEFKRLEQEMGENDVQKRKEIESLRDKVKQQFEVFFGGSLSVAEMAEKIDELVNNVINLKSAVASQSILVARLRTEIDMLEAQVEVLEDDKDALIDGKKKIREMEEKFNEIQDLSQSFEDQNNSLQTHFTEAHCSLDHLSEKVLSIKEKFEKEQSSSMAVKSSNEKASKGGEKKLKMVKTGTELKENSPEKESSDEENSNCSKDLQAAEPGIVMVSTSLPKESQETGEKLDHDDGDAKLKEKDKDVKERESVATCTNENLKPWEKREDLKEGDNVPKVNSTEKLGLKEVETEDKEKNLLMEYSLKLRNKDTEKKLKEVKENNQDEKLEIMLQLKKLNKSNAMKDELIRSLQEKLSLLQAGLGENNKADQNVAEKIVIIETQDAEKEVKQDFDLMIQKMEMSGTDSEIENKFRADIDELLEENLDFWCRFSNTYQEVNMFEARVKDLSAEVSKIVEQRRQDGSSSSECSPQSEVKQLSKHLKQVHNELTAWAEDVVSLEEELRQRFSSLCELQEEITMALRASAEDDEFKFTCDQAARFRGEILDMKQQNIRVANELQAGLDNVTGLQLEIERSLAKLSEGGRVSRSKNCRSDGQLQRSDSGSRKVPLSAFIFGGKLKKQKTSILRRMNTRMSTVLLRSVNSNKY
ncbi:Networked 2D [Hibiscus trionum]|uniref:Networked 2D n=1 Tax=Hibiscus trionum TaxID=183268 RepID=A0A9W7LLJ6_HIBTR|nr:Networked 2D [Hibiscus trionum]